MNLKQFDSYLLKDFELKTTKQTIKSYLITHYNDVRMNISFVNEKQTKIAIKKLENFIENKIYEKYLEETIEKDFENYKEKHLIDSNRFPYIKDLKEFRRLCILTDLDINEHDEISVHYHVKNSGMYLGLTKFEVILNNE